MADTGKMDATPATSAAVEALARAAAEFLRRYPPFDAMEPEALSFIGERLGVSYHAAGARILAPEDGEPQCLNIVKSGLVRLVPEEGGAAGAEVTLAPGECFSVGALLEGRATGSVYTAAADTFCYRLAAPDFHELLGLSARFREFSTRYLASLLRESRRLNRMHAASRATEEQAMGRALRSIIRHTPITCAPQTPTGEALRLMRDAGIGSILVTRPGGVLAGILTRHDVLDRVALAGCRLEEPVAGVMTPSPRTLPAEANAYEAALLIARHGIRHVPVVDGGRLIGVVTERDLFALQRVGLRSIQRAIASAPGLEELVQAARDIRALARALAEEGAAAEPLILIISTLNDALTRRVLDLEQARHDLAGAAWGWLGFGSEGRYEQTISTDQDNGLIFAAGEGEPAEALRERLLPCARAVNRALEACGYPRCEGGIMAGNPKWCLSLKEWGERFDSWIADTDPRALLNAVIFFDFRLLHGREDLAERLRERLLARAAATPRFLRQMAAEAIAVRPPLGLISDFVTERAEDGRETLDLKRFGARLFVDAARVIALANGVAHTATAERLRQGGARGGARPEETAAAVEGFLFIQMLRLRRQVAAGAGLARAAANRVVPEELNEVDRRTLKECLRQARRLQARLALDHRL
ncbi:MAG: CBS domain-containing protein [Burkholderiales bacterium]|nr:CBS domain-containing protein [Burkholderiales bacterium]